jgi:hypothetical protein
MPFQTDISTLTFSRRLIDENLVTWILRALWVLIEVGTLDDTCKINTKWFFIEYFNRIMSVRLS